MTTLKITTQEAEDVYRALLHDQADAMAKSYTHYGEIKAFYDDKAKRLTALLGKLSRVSVK